MTAVLDLDTARNEYAQWFVKRHYLKKKYHPKGEWLYRWRRVKAQGYIRYYTRKHEPVTDSKGKQLSDGYESTHDELERDYSWVLYSKEPEKQWWRIDLNDLDSPANDENLIVSRYRCYRKHAEEMAVFDWLLAEAEYHVVTNEAWLRAYGVEVEATE